MLLSLWAVSVAFGRKRIQKGRTRQERFLILILATGLFRTGGMGLAGLDLAALRLGVWLLLILWVLLTDKSFAFKKLPLPILLYSLFLLWALGELIRAPDLFYGLRVYNKLLYPFTVLLLGYVVGRQGTSLQRFWKPIIITSFIIFLFVGGFTERFFPFITYAFSGLFWNRAAVADHAAVMGGICLAFAVAYGWQHNRYLYLSLWFWMSSFFVINRTGILGLFGGLAGFVFGRYQAKSLPYIVCLFMVGLAIFLYSDILRQNLFIDSNSVDPGYFMRNPMQIDLNNIDSSGRFKLWEIVLDEFFWPDPLIGSGLGSTQYWLYTSGFFRIQVEHSTYVRLLSDTGLIGFSLYVSSLLSFLFIVIMPTNKDKDQDKLFAQYATCGAVGAIICCMGFDNILNYQLVANQYPFAIGGIYLGLRDGKIPLVKNKPKKWPWAQCLP